MLSRLLDPTQGLPRDRVFWLVLAAIISVQLLAFYSVCHQQVQKAQERRAAAQMERLAAGDCPQSLAPSLRPRCANSPNSHATAARMLGQAGAVPAAYVLR